ncbi:CCAAT-binding transcription factor, putative [Schistosoma mansoni]|uniref:CCAAT-binding transcription factor, putative n=1 Tax=Schistosoma mansoni TaxID=6183 RepID=G4M0Q4_SCHMA|nr:CCAAT-binding transcription factor, putative [Schistosoma mansoni]|eukprot:XP_018647070.1 CCAAT-binding transcription factor, putative [Schistosoma mansoni]
MDYSSDPLTDCQSQMLSFWDLIRVEIDGLKCDHAAFKTQDLPLARIKKIMKLDDDIKCMMISAEAPILFAKAAELFIRELTLRAWIHTERNRRRTLQRNDIAMAVSDGDTDQFDFLIDIVPREEARGHRRPTQTTSASNANGNSTNIKSENPSHRNNFLTNTNDTHSLSLGQNSGHMVVSGLSNDVTGSSTQPQTVTVALASAALAGATSVNSAIPCQTLVQQNQPTAVHFTTISSGSGLAIAQSSANSGSTVIAASAPNATTVATTAAPLQYVLQLPVGTAGASAGQPFQIQVLPQHFQAANTDAVSAGQAGAILADGNTLPLVQVVSQPGGIAVPIIQEAGGSRTQILQLQMPESTAGQRPTLFLQQAGALLGTHMGAVIASVDGHSQQIMYSLQAQPLVSSNSSSRAQVLLSLDEASECISSIADSNCITSNSSIHTGAAQLLDEAASELDIASSVAVPHSVSTEILGRKDYTPHSTELDHKSIINSGSVMITDDLVSLTEGQAVEIHTVESNNRECLESGVDSNNPHPTVITDDDEAV